MKRAWLVLGMAAGVGLTCCNAVSAQVREYDRERIAERAVNSPYYIQDAEPKDANAVPDVPEDVAADKKETKTAAEFEDMLDDFEKRWEKSQKKYAKFVEEQDELWDDQKDTNKSMASDIKNAVVKGTSGTASMKIVGRVHVDYWGFPESDPGTNFLETGNTAISPQDRLGFRRMRFGVRGDVNDQMEYRIEMEFAGGNRSEFRDAWLGFKDLGNFGKVLIGNQKRPYGLDHLNSSRYNVFIERPFVIESFNQDARRLGIASYNVSEDQAWNWRYGVYNQELIQATGNYISDHIQPELAGRLANTIWYDETSGGRGYAHWAISGTVAKPDGSAGGGGALGNSAANAARFRHRPEARTRNRWLNTGRIAGADYYELIGLESVVNVGAFQLVGEYQNTWMQREGFNDLHMHGGYMYASYFLTGEHIPWSRKSGTLGRVKPFENFFLLRGCKGDMQRGIGAWQIAARYSYADFNDNDINGGVGEAITLGLNWHWNPNARMQFNYIFGSVSEVNSGGALQSGDYQIVGTRFMIDF